MPSQEEHNRQRRDPVFGREPDAIAGKATAVGQERLRRSNAEIFVTGFIGGVEVSLGGLAAMAVLGASLEAAPALKLYGALALAGVVFPAGFLFVILGRSELFTENFLIPVAAWFRDSLSLRALGELWGISLAGNLVGCGLIAALVSVPEAIGKPILAGYAAYSAYKLSLPLLGLFVSAVFAGMTMTVLTWLLLAVKDAIAKIVVIWIAGYALFATNMSHVVVGAALILAGFAPAGHSFLDAVRWIAVATVGNVVGGVGFVTLFRLTQARATERSRERAERKAA
jgi:formate/nitrite transporter FocA (FNT family)